MKMFLAFSLTATMMLWLLAACSGGSGNADGGSEWPEREVRLSVPYKEGGGSHKTALMIKSAAETNKLMRQPFIVVCMPNAATLEGQEEVLNAAPDGYTLLVHHNAMINNYALGKQQFSYDDFEMIGQLYSTPLAIGVRADSPWKTLDELVAAIKAKPGTYSWTWAGLGGNTHFAAYAFYEAAGFSGDDIIPSITKGDGDSLVSLVGGHSDIAIAQTNAFTEYVASGDVRVLGHSGQGEVNVGGQTVKSWTDLGYNGTYNLRCFVFATKGTPEAVLASIREVIQKVVGSEEFQKAMLADGFTPEYLPPQAALEAFKKEADSARHIAGLMHITRK